MKFLPISDSDRSEMLRAIGVSSIEDLFASIPAEVRQSPNLPPPLSEIEVRRLLGSLAARNANARESAFSSVRPSALTGTSTDVNPRLEK